MLTTNETIHISDDATDEDLLGRIPFAKNLADLIISAPEKSSFRIGVYGDWGEGKSSVLKMMGRQLRNAGHAVIPFTPWTSSSAEELLINLLLDLAKGLNLPEEQEIRKALKTASLTQTIINFGKTGKDLNPIIGTLISLGDLGAQKFAGKVQTTSQDKLISSIQQALLSRRAVVFVDDLDRLRPDLLPGLLLNLRETLDLPNVFYVMALSPQIVGEGLTSQHPGWDSASNFLEKIIEYPAQLPEPTEGRIRAFIRHYTDRLGGGISDVALSDLIPYLPKNPRKVKSFLRYLYGMRTQFSRFDPEEINFPKLYLCQLLRLEFPEQTRKICADKEVLDGMASYAVSAYMNTANREQPGRFPANDESPEIKYAPKSEAEQNRFRSLCNAVKSSSNASRYSLAQMLKLLDNPPLVTFKEAKDAWQSFRDVALHQDMRSALTTRLGDDYGEISIEVLSALIVTTTEIRVSTQSPLIEADTKDEQNDVASLVLSLGHFINFLLTYEQGRVQTPLHDVNLENFTDNILKYAHFEEPSEIYGAIRNQDIELLELMISRTSLDETERVFGILRDQRSMIRYRWSSTSRSRPEIDRIIDQLANRISDRLLDRFSQPDGIEILMKDKFLDEQARQAFAADSPVHFPENRTRLLAIAGDAKNDQAIQRNFLSYFNMLSYIAVRGSSFYDQVQCKALVNDHNFIDAIWSAAVASPLNLRVVGSLRDYRQELITKLSVPNECLREPEWYRAMVSYHWANGPENADNVNTESDDL